MKKIFLTALLVPAMALAQTFPSPTFSSVTIQNPLSISSGGTGSAAATGTGSVVLSNSPSLTTPNLGTPSAVTLTNGTGLPVSTGISGLGTGVAAALGSAATGSGSLVLSTSPMIASPTVTGSFTATGLVTTADLAPNATVNYTGSGTGSVTRTSTQRFSDDIHIEDYCSAALMTSGGDVTSCFQNAINALPAQGGRCITLPANPSGVTWSISSTINIGNGTGGAASTDNSICVRGSGSASLFGQYGTTLTWTGSSGGTMISVNGPINNYELSNLNLNGNNLAGTVLHQGSVRFSDLHNLEIAAFLSKGIDTQGLGTTGDLNFMMDWSKLYVSTGATNAIGVNFDGVITSNTDTWLTTIRNSRFESLGTGGIAMRLGYSDNILFEQLHLVTGTSGGKVQAFTGNTTSGSNTITSASSTSGMVNGMYLADFAIGSNIPAGTKITNISGSTITLSNNATVTQTGASFNTYETCGLLLDSSTTLPGNTFPSGHQFDKTATDNVCLTYDPNHPMGVMTVYGFGVGDHETIPNDPHYIGTTELGNTFGAFGGAILNTYSPSYSQNGGTAGTGNTITGRFSLQNPYADVSIQVTVGASGVTTPGFSLSLGLPVTPTSINSACSGINITTGVGLSAAISNGANTVVVRSAAGAFPIANGDNIALECRYIY